MPYTTKNPPDWLKDLPAGAIKAGVGVFNAVFDGDKKNDDEARQAAWAAVEREYEQEGDDWIKKAEIGLGELELVPISVLRSSPFYHQVDLVITKATTKGDGRIRWQLTASTTDEDSRGDKTSIVLFNDWVSRITSKATVDWLPPPQTPFLGLSHYPSLEGKAIAGEPERLFIDGSRFKADGYFCETEIGLAASKAVQDERAAIKQGETIDQPIRISAAWWDIAHAHNGYLFCRQSLVDECPVCAVLTGQPLSRDFQQGQLDHFALTRVPINPQTDIGLLEQSQGTITRQEDAASIIGGELAEKIETEYRRQHKPGQSISPQVALATRGEQQGAVESEIQKGTPMYDYPLGGATTFAEAEAFMDANSTFGKLLTQWDILTVIINNLLDMLWYGDLAVKDAIPLFKTAVSEFSERVAIVQSEAVKAFLSRNQSPKSEDDPMTQDNTQTQAPPTEPTPQVVQATPVVQAAPVVAQSVVPAVVANTVVQPEGDAYSKLRDTVNAALEAPNLTRQVRLEQIQQGLVACAGEIEAEVEDKVGPDLADTLAVAISTAMEKALTPLTEQIAQLMAVQQSQSAAIAAVQSPQQIMTNQVPVQKSVTAPQSLVVASGAQPAGSGLPVSPITGQPSGLTAIIQKSVGMRR